jgi:dCMP deaminase
MSFEDLKGSHNFHSFSDLVDSGFVNLENWSAKPYTDIIFDQIKNRVIVSKWDNSALLDKSNPSIHESFKSLNMDMIYLRMAKTWGENSHSKRMQVGCLMVKNKSIISDGYNGSPSGFPNICEDEDMVTLPYVLHAEANAITKLAKSTQSSDGSTLYVTLSPCFECSKLIIQSGIKRVVFSELYRKPESIPFLLEAGVEVVKINEPY